MPAPMGQQQWARCTKELVWGTFNGTTSTPDVAATVFWLEFENENGFNMRKVPVIQSSRAATGNLRRRRTGRKSNITGQLNIKAFPDLMPNLVPWACTPTVVSSKLTLPSYTIDWFDGTVVRRFLGVRVDQFNLKSDNGTDWAMVAMQLRARQEVSGITLAEPALSVYPVIGAFEHTDSGGFITVDSVITGYKNLSITYINHTDPQFDEITYLNTHDYCGRDVNWEVQVERFDDSLRTKFEAQAAVTGVVKWAITTPSAHSAVFTLNGRSYIDDQMIDRKFTGKQYQTIRLASFEDMTAGSDATATAA